MEPMSPNRLVPKLHLLMGASSDHERSNQRQPETVVNRPGGYPSDRSNNNNNLTQWNQPHRPAIPAKILPDRVSGASIGFVESPKLPRMLQRKGTDGQGSASAFGRSSSSNHAEALDEFRVLHPSLDLTDETGELSRLMLNKWSIDKGEEAFSSISLFCEMKLNEAKSMSSWVDSPNRFFTTVCCQLLEKYVQRLAASEYQSHGKGVGVGHSAAFLQRIHRELVNAIFVPSSSIVPQSSSSSSSNALDDYENRIPYFLEYKRLKRNAHLLIENVERREKNMATKQRFSVKIDQLLGRHQEHSDSRTQGILFRAWAKTVASQNEIRTLKCRSFRSSRRMNLSAVFRSWRIESLRRAYQRESVEYQTMLSLTAASLSRKDVLIAEADSKMTSMAKIIDSLTEANTQLALRVEHLEANRGPRDGTEPAPETSSYQRRPEVQFEHMDTLISPDDEKMDRTNRMLLETLFGMARMVESCAIQMSKDVMDALENQIDGTMLQNLAEMIQADKILKEKTALIQNGPGAIAEAEQKYASGRRGALRDANANTVTVKSLAHMPIDELLLRWFQMHLQMSSSVEKASDRVVKNFTTDLVDGRRYSFLLHRLFPTWFDASMVHEIDVDQRLRNVATFTSRIQPELPAVVTSDSIHSGSVPENIAFVAMLFGASLGSIRKINLDRQRGNFLNIITSWKRVRSLLVEVKRMNDNYDSLMVAHLLKEMRSCESVFKQLNSELSVIAIASNETSSTLSQIAYKVLSITWRCLHARASNTVGSLNTIDERWHDRVKEFLQLNLTTVRELLMVESESTHQLRTTKTRRTSVRPVPIVSEEDVNMCVDALRSVLVVYCKDLYDIFKHYSASGGGGSVVSMSLGEYNKFIKDCCVCEKKVTPPVAELIYHMAMNSDPADGVHATLQRVPDSKEANPAPEAGAVDLEEREMVGREFVDALIRLAAAKFTNLPLQERVRELMEQDILPNALRSQSEIFRAEVNNAKVHAVFLKHKLPMQNIFRYYASMHSLREQQSTIALKEFLIFAKDCKLIGSFVTEQTLKQVLVNLQHDDEPFAGDDKLRVDFMDFQEAIAALTEYVICNPYVPLYKRIEQFIIEMILPRARQKKKTSGE